MALIYKLGSRGETVKQIQRALGGAGYGVMVDGIYGSITEEAVRAFQTKNNLKADGIVGPATFAALVPFRWKKSKRTITELIVHCTATPEYRDYTVTDIRRWHKARGWSDIGYHYVVYRDGSVHEGRDVDLAGAHCQGHNANSIGICYVGGVATDGKTPKDTRTELQKVGLLSILYDMRKLYPDARIYGHRNFSSKACPSFDAKYEYRLI